jgi:ADP-ribose pyrophosphatase
MRELFRGSRFDVYQIELAPRTPGKPPQQRELIVHPGAVVVLPMLDDQVVMIRNQRWAVNQELWELPAGTLEPPEPPDACASRELIEETGYKAGHIEPLAEFYSSPGFCSELLHTFLATDLTHVGQQLEETEKITVELLPFDRVLEMVKSNQIRDGKTMAALLYYHAFTRAK